MRRVTRWLREEIERQRPEDQIESSQQKQPFRERKVAPFYDTLGADMKDDLTYNPANHPENALASELQEVIDGRKLRGGASRADNASVPLEGSCPEPGEWPRLLSGEARPADIDVTIHTFTDLTRLFSERIFV